MGTNKTSHKRASDALIWRGAVKTKPSAAGCVESVGLNVAAEHKVRTTATAKRTPTRGTLAVSPDSKALPPEVIRPSGRVRLKTK